MSLAAFTTCLQIVEWLACVRATVQITDCCTALIQLEKKWWYGREVEPNITRSGARQLTFSPKKCKTSTIFLWNYGEGCLQCARNSRSFFWEVNFVGFFWFKVWENKVTGTGSSEMRQTRWYLPRTNFRTATSNGVGEKDNGWAGGYEMKLCSKERKVFVKFRQHTKRQAKHCNIHSFNLCII